MTTPTLAEDRQTLLTTDGAGKPAKAAALARLEAPRAPGVIKEPRVLVISARAPSRRKVREALWHYFVLSGKVIKAPTRRRKGRK